MRVRADIASTQRRSRSRCVCVRRSDVEPSVDVRAATAPAPVRSSSGVPDGSVHGTGLTAQRAEPTRSDAWSMITAVGRARTAGGRTVVEVHGHDISSKTKNG